MHKADKERLSDFSMLRFPKRKKARAQDLWPEICLKHLYPALAQISIRLFPVITWSGHLAAREKHFEHAQRDSLLHTPYCRMEFLCWGTAQIRIERILSIARHSLHQKQLLLSKPSKWEFFMLDSCTWRKIHQGLNNKRCTEVVSPQLPQWIAMFSHSHLHIPLIALPSYLSSASFLSSHSLAFFLYLQKLVSPEKVGMKKKKKSLCAALVTQGRLGLYPFILNIVKQYTRALAGLHATVPASWDTSSLR